MSNKTTTTKTELKEIFKGNINKKITTFDIETELGSLRTNIKKDNRDHLRNEISLDEALERSFNDLIVYVMPAVEEVENSIDKNNKHAKKFNYVLTGFLGKEFFVIKEGLEDLGDQARWLAGMRLNILFKPETNTLDINYYESEAPITRRHGATVKLGKSKVKLCYGQNILVTAPPEGGKSFATETIVDSYLKKNPKVIDYRILFGERKDDKLGRNTIDCNSSTTVEYQLYTLYKHLTSAVRDAYLGNDVVVAIDSLTRQVEVLTNKYSHSHMLSGGISSSVKNMVGRLFRMPGAYGTGTLTMVGTCLWARTNNSWKVVYSELSSIATAEFFPSIRSGEKNKSRRSPNEPIFFRKDLLGLITVEV